MTGIGEIIGTIFAVSLVGLYVCGFLILLLILWMVTR